MPNKENNINPLSMSDEDILNMPIPEYSDEEDTDNDIEGEEVTIDNVNDQEGDDDYDDDNSISPEDDPFQSNTSEDSVNEDDGEQDQEDEDENEEESDEDIDDEVTAEKSNNTKSEDTKNIKSSDTKDTIDYKAAYEQIFAPFRANGKDVSVENVDQAIRLMQMGAGFNAKMTSLKGPLRILKMLEKNALMDEDKLNHLIDLDKKDPKAIMKLIKESGIDPLEMDLEEETSYSPKNYSVSDKEIELDEVLDDISSSPSYKETVKVIGTDWDKASRNYLGANPADIREINNHIESGIFKKINDVVSREKMLGRLQGVSDIDAYRKIGTLMYQQGLLNDSVSDDQANQSNIPDRGKSIPSKVKTSNPELRDRKRAAGSTSSTPVNKVSTFKNPLSLSDEEFEKLPMP